MLKARRALISVSNKRGLEPFVLGLSKLGIEILSTGGTYKTISDLGVPVVKVADATGFPEILDGRVKTLHPTIHGGILADRGRARHLTELAEHGIPPIDLVVVNLYPFREATASPDAKFSEGIEMIDIGGPCMVRAAAKNHAGVAVIVDPDDYPQVLAALEDGEGTVTESLRRRLAIKAFRHTQSYDAAIATWLEDADSDGAHQLLPSHLLIDLERRLLPRYGENPHQEAAVYQVAGSDGVLDGFKKLHGKELSYNNLLDAHAARRLAGEFEQPAVAITKHNNPCGVGRGTTYTDAYQNALACDPTSAFGSIVAINGVVDLELAEELAGLFVEVVVAPKFEPAAFDRLTRKKNLRLLEAPVYQHRPNRLEFRGIDGGFLVQTTDGDEDSPDEWTCPTARQPTDEERDAMIFLWQVVRNVRSNAIVVGNSQQTVGVGAGQMSRVDSCRLAVEKAVLPLADCAAASDAFFPFRDGVDLLAEAGVRAIVQPGGSKRDDEVIAAADEHDIALLMTSRRHFKH